MQRGLVRRLRWAQSPGPTAVCTGLPRPLGCPIHQEVPTTSGTLGARLPRKEPRTPRGARQWHRLGGPGLGPPSPASYLRGRGVVPFPLGGTCGAWEGTVTLSVQVLLPPNCVPGTGGGSKAGRKDLSPVELSLEWGCPAQPCGPQGLSSCVGPVPCLVGPLAASRGSTPRCQ